MARNPAATYGFTMIDASGEKSSVQFGIDDYNVLFFASLLDDLDDFRTALAGVTLGKITNDVVSPYVTKYDVTTPTDVNAQRERKWLVRYMDDTTFSKYSVEIPTAKLTGLMLDGSDRADLTATAMAAFVTACEQCIKSPDGNDIVVLDVIAVGRNL